MNKVNLIQVKQSKSQSYSERLSVYFLNRKIDFMTMEAALRAIIEAAIARNKMVVANYNVHAFNLSMLIPRFLDFYEDAELKICDGMGIIKGLKLMGISLSSTYKTPLTLLVPRLFHYCDRHQLSVFLLGSKPKHLDSALQYQQKKYPNVQFAGHHGYFDKEDSQENQKVLAKINRFQPDILIVGMGMPIQEIWIQKNYQNINASVIMPCGAVIDRLAGVVPNCPPWVSNFGLEWLYRLLREPKRLASRYLLGNPLFLLVLIWAKFHSTTPVKIISNQSDRDAAQKKHQVINL